MGRIRNPSSVSIAGTSVTGVKSIQWDTSNDYNRDTTDDSLHGTPVLTREQGSGTIELEGGTVPACYDQDIVVKHQEVSVATGTETKSEKTTTFHHGTLNKGANVPSGDVGSRSIKFDFADVVES